MSVVYNPYDSEEVKRVIETERNKWKEEYERLFIQLCNSREFFDGSVPCAYARKNGLGEPHHHNVWVAMPTAMAKKGYATQVKGQTMPGSGTHSHNNNVGYWKSNIFKGI